MKLTLLEIVQDILSVIDSDEVSSISDTVESEQIAIVARDCFLNMVSMRYWPYQRRLISLESSSDSTKPTLMKIPENVNRIEEILYDMSCDAKNFETLTYLEPYEFLSVVYKFDATQDTTGSYTLKTRYGDADTSQVLLYKKNRNPQYWTSFDDTYLVFDSYDANIEDTLQTSKTVVWAEEQPIWTMADDFVPSIPEHFFSMYMNDVRTTAFMNHKQTANPKYAADLRRNMTRMQKSRWRENGNPKSPNYGRK